jgi:hypothetical protein
MIPRKIGAPPDQRGFNIDRGIYIMAVNKSAGVSKLKLTSSTRKAAVKKKAAPKKTAAMKTAASKKTGTMRKAVSKKTTTMTGAASTKTAMLKKAVSKKAGTAPKAKLAPKKAAPKKAAGPKLTAAQHDLLKRVVANKDARGYHTANKPEHRVLETLLKHKVIKKGPKHPKTNYFHYQVSTIGKKYLESGAVGKS